MREQLILYRITNNIGSYYVTDEDSGKAERKLKAFLDKHEYGVFRDRGAHTIEVIAKEMTDEPLGLSGNFLLV